MAQKEQVEKGRTLQLVVFRLGKEEFGAEITSVLEISRMLEITHIPQAPGFIEGVINLRGRVIAVIDLARQFGLKKAEANPKTARIVVVQVGGETIGLIVDEVPEVLRISDGDIEPTPELIQSEVERDYIRGVAKLGERLVILLDLDRVLEPQAIEALNGVSQPEVRV